MIPDPLPSTTPPPSGYAEFVQGVLAQLPWYYPHALLDKLHAPEDCRWHAAMDVVGLR